MFVIEYKKKTQQCHIWELNLSFLFNLHQDTIQNYYPNFFVTCDKSVGS
jgi:hypothetical protein